MIHINKSKDKKFYVTIIGKNNEVLNTSEMLNTKQAAWVNIVAVIKSVFADTCVVSDCTIKKPAKYVINSQGVKSKV